MQAAPAPTIGMNVLNVLYLLYALSACSSVCYFANHKEVYTKQKCVEEHGSHREKSTLSFIRKFSIFAVFMLAFGTGTDNIRLFLGSLVKDLPDGTLFAVGLAKCNKNISCGNALGNSSRPIFLEVITWFCFGSHEIFGALFSIPTIYLWYCVPSKRKGCGSSGKSSSINDQGMLAVDSNGTQALLPSASTLSDAEPPSTTDVKPKKCCCCVFFDDSTRWFFCKLVVIISFLFSAISTVFFVSIEVGSGALELKLNSNLFIWQYSPREEQPFSLLGVFFYSIVNLFVCTKLWCAGVKKYRWYYLISYFCFLGQGGCQSLGPYAFLLSNCLEQISLWSLIIFGQQVYQRHG